MTKARGSSVPASFPIRGWFADSHPHFRRDLLALARPKSYAAGSVIFQAGELGQDVFGVSSGVVTMQSRLSHADAVLLHMLRPGEWFGTASALLERGRRITAVARTDVHLLRVPGDELRGRPAALGEQALGVRSGSRHVFRNPGLASGARNALQRVQEHVQPRRGRVLASATGGAQLQVADRDRTRAPARYCGFRLRTSRRFLRGAPDFVDDLRAGHTPACSCLLERSFQLRPCSADHTGSMPVPYHCPPCLTKAR